MSSLVQFLFMQESWWLDVERIPISGEHVTIDDRYFVVSVVNWRKIPEYSMLVPTVSLYIPGE